MLLKVPVSCAWVDILITVRAIDFLYLSRKPTC
jgi:hypothetical protein